MGPIDPHLIELGLVHGELPVPDYTGAASRLARKSMDLAVGIPDNRPENDPNLSLS